MKFRQCNDISEINDAYNGEIIYSKARGSLYVYTNNSFVEFSTYTNDINEWTHSLKCDRMSLFKNSHKKKLYYDRNKK